MYTTRVDAVFVLTRSLRSRPVPLLRFSDGRRFHVRDTRKVALPEEQRSAVRAVEICAVDGASEISDEHPASFVVQGQADAFHQMIEHDFRLFALARFCIERRTVYGVTARRVATVRPIQCARG